MIGCGCVGESERSCSFYGMSSRLRMETNIECTISLKENFNMIRIRSVLLFPFFLIPLFVIFSFLSFSMSFCCLIRRESIFLSSFSHASQHLFICLFCISSTYRKAARRERKRSFNILNCGSFFSAGRSMNEKIQFNLHVNSSRVHFFCVCKFENERNGETEIFHEQVFAFISNNVSSESNAPKNCMFDP